MPNLPSDPMRLVKIVLRLAVTLAPLVIGCWMAVEWGYNRIYVLEGESLLLRYKGPPLPFLPGSKKDLCGRIFAKWDAFYLFYGRKSSQ